ncbi:MAG TPA: UDP-N-acetylmuramate dehydrogenase [bacterium]|nr:UDP-N-acetylmuramate dehydrogenase [bacterium]HOL46575.1 UDP-N-acetylmuramate dehydrogenase [bacterium]HPQ17854.1 UDP-N-acetylmuramate dehydrogenase [bacterium]
MKIYYDYSLKKLTTISIGGIVKKYIEIFSIDELYEYLKISKNFFIIGNGSNLIFKDKYYDLEIIKLTGEFEKIYIFNHYIKIFAGCQVNKMINFFIKNNISNFEWLIGIPATFAGLICNNAGAFGFSISDFIFSVECLDLSDDKIIEFSKNDLFFNYRDSYFKHNKKYIILSGMLNYKKYAKENIVSELKKNMKHRLKTQPIKFKNAGSVFKNFSDCPAALLLEKTGLKGFRINDVGFSEIHSNFIVNYGAGKFDDFIELVSIAKKKVKDMFNRELELEIEII